MSRSIKLVLGYLFFGALWIYFSDWLVSRLVSPESFLDWLTFKGVLFVLITGVLLYFERKISDDTLVKTERHLMASQETARLGSFSYGRLGQSKWSAQMFALCSVSRKRALRTDELINLFFEPDRWEIATKINQLWKDGLGFEGEYRLVPGRAEPIWVRLKVKAITDRQGRALELTGIVQDITETKHNLLELENMASFLTLSPIPIFEVDFSGRVGYCNPACKNSFLHEVEGSGGSLPADFGEMVANFSAGKIGNGKVCEIRVAGKRYLETIYFVPSRKTVRVYALEVAG